MEQKTVVFRKGDVIVSGGGNIGIFNGFVDGNTGIRLTAYGCPADTDLRYARQATEEEKKFFFGEVAENGMKWDGDAFAIYDDPDKELSDDEYHLGRIDWKADGMHPFKVVTGEKKKRVRATWRQVRELEASLAKKDELLEGYEMQADSDSRLLDKFNDLVNKLRQEVDKLMIENERLRNRSFLERVFNK